MMEEKKKRGRPPEEGQARHFYVNVRLTERLSDRLERYAKSRRCSKSSVAREAIDAFLGEEGY